MKKIIRASSDARHHRKVLATITPPSGDPIFDEILRQLEGYGIHSIDSRYDGVPELISNYPEYEQGDLEGAVSRWIQETESNYPEFFDSVDASDDIMGADTEGATGGGYDDAVKDIQADFDYIVEGLDKMSRMGAAKEKEALGLVLEFSGLLTNMINTVASSVTE